MVKYMEKNLNTRKPGDSECIWSVPWQFITSRFHRKMLTKFTAIVSFPQEQTSKNIILCSMTGTVITIIISDCF